MKRADFIIGCVGLALTLYIWITTSSFPEDQVVQVGPAFFPRMLAVGLGLTSLTLIIQAIMKVSANQKQDGEDAALSLRDPGIRRALIALGATIIYCLLLESVGFIPLSIVYLLLLMLLMKEKKYLQMCLTSVAVTGVLYAVFNMLLNITLPLGSLYGF